MKGSNYSFDFDFKNNYNKNMGIFIFLFVYYVEGLYIQRFIVNNDRVLFKKRGSKDRIDLQL